MNNEIIYSRQFINVGDKYIPLFQHGNSSHFQLSLKGKRSAVKAWSVFNNEKPNKILFTKQEIRDLAASYNTYEFYRTRNTPFKEREFENWFINGLNKAKSIEYFVEHGNKMVVIESISGREVEHPISSTYELLETLDGIRRNSTYNSNVCTQVNFRFCEQKLNLPKQMRNREEYKEYPFYYVLSSSEGYFVRRFNSNYKCSTVKDKDSVVRKFKNEKAALKYLDQYQDLKARFTIERVDQSVIL
ncbi:hypothetical protein [Priestia aryabhattai]